MCNHPYFAGIISRDDFRRRGIRHLGRKHKNANINELKVNDDIISDDKSITETLNEYFINIGMKMAAESACQSNHALNDQVISESTACASS